MKIVDVISKVNDSISIYRYDNGYMLEIGGYDKKEEWVTRKIVCTDLKEVLTLIEEYSKLPLN